MALFAVVVVLLSLFLNWYVSPTTPGERKDLVLAVAQILAGTALLSGLYFTWRTLQVNREGQITERFTRAIEQLGATHDDNSKNLELRLGGIYALERISRESEEDHWSIMEVLTAYVRQHAPWRPEYLPAVLRRGEASPVEEERMNSIKYWSGESEDWEYRSGESETTEIPTPDPDIQAIMTVLRRRTRSFGHGEPETLDLRKTDLRGVDLSGANLSGADLREAILWKANFSGANLSGADLSGARPWPTKEDVRRFSGADPWAADLWKANFSRANLSGAYLWGADLREAILWKANFSGVNLSGAYLSGAYLWKANFSGADLWEANFSGASFYPASREEKEEARSEAYPLEAILTQDQLNQADGDENTHLPPGLKPPEHWGVKTDEQTEGE